MMHSKQGRVIILLWVGLALSVGVMGLRLAGATAQGAPPGVGDVEPFCGMQYVTAEEDLATVRALGINVVLQTFRHDGDPDEWRAQLDLAQEYQLHVIGRLWPEGWVWDGEAWQIDAQARSFVQTVAEHPATLAVYALHEPYWRGCRTCGLTTAEQQTLYRELKAIAGVPLYSELGSITYWVERGAATTLQDGMCDYCAVTFYPFFADGTYRRERFIERLEEDLAAIHTHAPNARLSWGMQVFAQSESPEPRRMPTAQEIADISAIVAQRDVAGIFWYVWEFGPLYDDFLSNHPELFAAVAGMPFCASTVSTPAPGAATATFAGTPGAVSASPAGKDMNATATLAPAGSPSFTPRPTGVVSGTRDDPGRGCGLAALVGGLPLVGLVLLARLGRRTGPPAA
jgi:hypothetical protein